MRSVFRLSALGFVTLIPLLASCDDGEPSGPGRLGDGEIRGVVARQKTGDGVPDMVIALIRGDSVVATAHSDGAGAFGFTGLAEGTYRMRLTGLEVAGLDPRFVALEPPEQSIVVGGDPVDAVFAVVGLIPPRVTGDVTCTGQPQPGVRVRVVGGDRDVTATTNAQGRFAALDLSAGFYAVIPLDQPCTLGPGFDVVELLPGQSKEVDFSG